MTTTAGEPRSGLRPDVGHRTVTGWLASVSHALDRPLTSYYLLLGASTLLLTIGLVMVLSASSVYSYKTFGGDSYHVFLRQLTWVGLALPIAFVVSRLPHRLIRAFAWPGLVAAVATLWLTTTGLGYEANGNQNWLSVGPLRLQPSEVAKLALILWCAHLYARKEKLLGVW